MPAPLFDDPRLLATSHSSVAPQMQMSGHTAALARADFVRSDSLRDEVVWSADAIVDLRRLGKGVGLALAIECAVGVSLYVAWQLWHSWL